MKETKQLILFLAAVAAQTVESSTDGDGLNFKDAPEFLDELMQAPEALKGVSLVRAEIENATSEQRTQLYAEVSEVIQGLTPDRFDGFVEAVSTCARGLETAFAQYKSL